MLPLEHSAILRTFIKLPFAIKIFALSFFEWPLKKGFTILHFRVVFNEVVQTTKDFMRDVTVINPDWLCELAPDFYQFGTVSINMDPEYLMTLYNRHMLTASTVQPLYNTNTLLL